jgi:hypothetical protein
MTVCAEMVTYSAKRLYALVSEGTPVMERRDDGNILHIRRKELTEKQKRHIKELAKLGYIYGTAAASQRRGFKVHHKAAIRGLRGCDQRDSC